ncbi:MAG TPA: sensor histidine kinase [Steroidobacteraceae bacterium]|nr:sensor histidine kinase [Steroidobacteraceae bacterium]
MSKPVPQRTASPVAGPIVAIVTAAAVAASLAVAALTRGAARSRVGRLTSASAAGKLDPPVEPQIAELSALSTHLQELAEKEKSVLARNLHDQLGGLLTAAKMDASWLQGRVGDDPAVQQRLQQLGNVLDEAMDVKRRVVEELRPSLLDHFGLPTALRAYLESVSAKSGLVCEMTIAEEADVPSDAAIGLFRVAQEAMTNVLRHASARCVCVTLACDQHGYSLRVADDGRGIDLASGDFRRSHGLTGMRHRVRALGGELALHSTPGRGTILEVEIPRSRPTAT